MQGKSPFNFALTMTFRTLLRRNMPKRQGKIPSRNRGQDWEEAVFVKFLRSAQGNVAIMTAIGGLALVGSAGVAIDYVRQSNLNTGFTAAADAASLAGAALIREHSEWTASKTIQQAKAEALKSWKSNLSSDQLQLISKPTVTVKQVNNEWSVQVSYNGKFTTSLLGALGIVTVPLEGLSVASAGQSQIYWSFNFAIDTSSSMGIGATQKDMDAMLADPNIGCMFACHYSTTGDDTVDKARAAGHKLRLDVVDEAVDDTIDLIEAKKDLKSQAALYGMTTGITPLVAETTDLSAVKDHKIQIAYIQASLGNTNFRSGFEQLTSSIGVSGDGTSATKSRKMVFIVTDGIHDTTVSEPNVDYVWWSDHQMGTIDPDFCDTMKDNGVIVGVLYVKYIVPAGYEGVLTGYEKKILPNMKACASDGFFHDATDAKDLKKAFSDLLSKAFATDVRLTQ